MGTLFAISLVFSLSVSVCYVVYKVLLSQSAWYSVNRVILLSVLLISFAIYPLVGILSVSQEPAAISIGELTATIREPEVDADIMAFSYVSLFLWLYAIVAGIMLLRLLSVVAGLAVLIARGEKCPVGRYELVLHDNARLVPFSWGRWIVLSRKDYDSTSDMTIIHETAHLDRKHWIDLLVAEAALIVAWYNPFLWMLRAEMQAVHEYEADAAVLLGNVDCRKYQLFLIEKTVGSRFHALTNSLNHSSLNKRITMMLSKKKSHPVLGYASMACAVAGVVMLVNQPAVASSVDKVSNSTVTVVSSGKGNEKSANVNSMNVAVAKDNDDAMAEFPGGEAALYKFINDNIKYPESVKNGQGMLILQFTVDEKGKVLSPSVAKSSGIAGMDAEGLRVAGLLPDFIPAKQDGKPVAVQFMLPIMFSNK
ncbi:MAG: M56 family metallopeptidase [Muribaculaceae bacterium]|nr:M56 family metallopeptidase [Muribaculaceae bacterium]